MSEQQIVSNEAEKQVRLGKHLEELKAYGLRGLEGRMQHGLDPAGMLAVSEIRSLVENISQSIGADMVKLEALTKDLHVGAVWTRANELAAAESPESKIWLLLANECHEVNDRDIDGDEYLRDVDRIKNSLTSSLADLKGSLAAAKNAEVSGAESKFKKIEENDNVPFADGEYPFLSMAIAGEKYGVWQDGQLFFAASDEMDYSVLDSEGLTSTEKEDRGRVCKFYQKDGQDVVKVLGKGFAIILNGDKRLACKLAKSAENIIEKSKEQNG